MKAQPWIVNPKFDLGFFILPGLVSSLIVYLLLQCFGVPAGSITPLEWLVFVVFIDVGHVYASLYRSYLDPYNFAEHRSLFVLTPALCFIGAVVVYGIDVMWFWRIMAYIAVFHFVRQQYGFIRIYGRQETAHRLGRLIDGSAIYLATIYPLIYWHTHQRDFQWFIPGDFVVGVPLELEQIAWYLYLGSMLAFLAKEAYQLKIGQGNIPKCLLLLSTAVVWYVGIVLLNGDRSFTITNVVAHGIPYVALVWIYKKRELEKSKRQATFLRTVLLPRLAVVFVGILIAFAIAEEALWDGLVWHEHIPWFKDSDALLSAESLGLIVPLLVVPQLTHYVTDAFLWRVRDSSTRIMIS